MRKICEYKSSCKHFENNELCSDREMDYCPYLKEYRRGLSNAK